MAHPDVEKQLLTLETQYWQALKDKDYAAAIRLTDDPCIVAGAQGVASFGREQFESMLDAPNFTLEEFELSDPQVRMLGTDVAILAYKVKEEVTMDGEAITLEAADASTWVRRGERWVCALHTESILGDPFGRDRKGKSMPSAE
jgi:ketosteroid isomerase-like protein